MLIICHNSQAHISALAVRLEPCLRVWHEECSLSQPYPACLQANTARRVSHMASSMPLHCIACVRNMLVGLKLREGLRRPTAARIALTWLRGHRFHCHSEAASRVTASFIPYPDVPVPMAALPFHRPIAGSHPRQSTSSHCHPIRHPRVCPGRRGAQGPARPQD